MLQSPPDVLVYQVLLPNSFIKGQLAKVKELGIPTVASVTAEKPNDVMRAVVANGSQHSLSGTLIGDSIVVDAKGAAKVVYVSDPTLTFFDPMKKSLKKELAAAGGSVDVLDISGAEIGKSVPTQVTSYLQSHPDVKYVVFPNAEFGLGLPQAMKAAGGLNVKIASSAPLAADLKDIKDGNQWISVAVEDAASGYRAVDTLARILEGSDFDPLPVGYHQILNKDNVTQTSAAPATPGSPDQFFKAWHVK
jgi:ABC-type sugar transport system substrate-binding protein